MTDSDKQLIMNLDHVETMKVLSVFKKLADEIVELKETNKELSESNKELNAKLDLEEQECASRMDCHVATKLEERLTDLLRANFQLQDVTRTYKKELDLEHMRYMEKAEEVAELKGQVEKNLERNQELKDFRSVCDSLSLPELTDDCLMEYITELKQEVKRLEREDDQMEDTLASLNFYKTELAEVKEENKKKAEEVAYLKERLQTRMNPVTNNDSRCGVVSVRCNYSYLAEFMECADIDIHKSRDVDEQQAYDGVIEKMSKEVEHVLDTYLQDSKICYDQELNIVIYERMKDIIDEAVTDGIITTMDNSSDED